RGLLVTGLPPDAARGHRVRLPQPGRADRCAAVSAAPADFGRRCHLRVDDTAFLPQRGNGPGRRRLVRCRVRWPTAVTSSSSADPLGGLRSVQYLLTLAIGRLLTNGRAESEVARRWRYTPSGRTPWTGRNGSTWPGCV